MTAAPRVYVSSPGTARAALPHDADVFGVELSLLGAAEPDVLHRWFDALSADGGQVVDPLARKPWGATDGQVLDRHGLRWRIGYEPSG